MNRILTLVLFLHLLNLNLLLGQNWLSIKIVKGHGIQNIFNKYELNGSECSLKAFLDLNNLQKNDLLKLGISYVLPIKKVLYNGISIRSTLGIKDYALAKKIEIYNKKMEALLLKNGSFVQSKELWVPIGFFNCDIKKLGFIPDGQPESLVSESSGLTKPIGKIYPIFGSDHPVVNKGNSCKGMIFYIKGGHGGPDPGAMAKIEGNICCEDEYAYDVALRLGHIIMEHGGIVYFIVTDNDGIREESYLKCDKDEKQSSGKLIPINQLRRLQGRTNYINSVFNKNTKIAASNQYFISIHIDSRSKTLDLDSHFYYYTSSKPGLELAKKVQNSFTEKYKQQLNIDFTGTIKGRDLYVLKYSKPTALFVELGNIKTQIINKDFYKPKIVNY